MDVANIAERLHLSGRVRTKAHELCRLAELRCLNTKSTSAVCRPAVCVHLAAQACGEPLDKTNEALCIRLSGTTKKLYEDNLLTTRKLLDLDPTSLAVRFGLIEAATKAEVVLAKFKDKLSATQMKHVQDNQAVYCGAALLVAYAELKTDGLKLPRVNVRQFAAACGCKESELTKIREAVAAANTTSSAAEDKAEEAQEDLEEEDSLPSGAAVESNPEKRARLSYTEWKKAILAGTAKRLGIANDV